MRNLKPIKISFINEIELIVLLSHDKMIDYHLIENEGNQFPQLPYAAQDTILKAARCKFN